MACKNILALLICSLFSFELYSQNNSINQDSINILNDEYYAKFMVVPEYEITNTNNHIIGAVTDFIQFYGILYDYNLIESKEGVNYISSLSCESSIVYLNTKLYISENESNYRLVSGPSFSSSIKYSIKNIYLNAPFSYSLSVLLGASYQHYATRKYTIDNKVLSESSEGYILPSLIVGLTVHSQKIPLSIGLSLGLNYGAGLFYCSILYGLK
jgi:hypothetical protein